jgi:hypothetical protein
MRNFILTLLICLLSAPGLASAAEPQDACGPEIRALFDTAVVETRGSGDRDVVVVTDPLCWHCRLGHKLLSEYPEIYRSVKLSFFPRRSNIGSDMAAWIMEDAAGDERLPELIDFAYKDLKRAKTEDVEEARMIMLVQFTEKFPWLVEGTTVPELFVRLKNEHEAHVLKEAELARAVHFPGTPILIVGKAVVVGYAPDPWIKTIKEAPVCE